MLEIRDVPFGSPEQCASVELRRRLLREPLGLGLEPDELAAESTQLHIVAVEDGTVVGCLLLVPIDARTMRMRQVAVEPSNQGRGIGRAMVAYSERKAVDRGCDRMTLHAREGAVQFYLSIKYVVVGQPFEEVTIPHRAMERLLE